MEAGTTLYNTGHVEFQWRLDYQPDQGRLQVSPTEGNLQAGECQHITIHFLPMVPEYFERHIHLAVSHGTGRGGAGRGGLGWVGSEPNEGKVSEEYLLHGRCCWPSQSLSVYLYVCVCVCMRVYRSGGAPSAGGDHGDRSRRLPGGHAGPAAPVPDISETVFLQAVQNISAVLEAEKASHTVSWTQNRCTRSG